MVKKDRKLKQKLKEELLGFNKQQAIAIGSGVYKIRIAAQGKGKSGGYRTYLLALEIEGILAPICLYAKNEKENLNYEEMTWHLNKTKEELI